MGVVVTDLFGNILKSNDAAIANLFTESQPVNFFQLLVNNTPDSSIDISNKGVERPHYSFMLELEGKSYPALGIRQESPPSPLPVIVWLITITSDPRIHIDEASLIRKNEALAKINTQMERFLYSTSHDLRSPLTSILGLVNLLRMERSAGAIQNYVGKIENCVLRLDEIIKDIMRFSKNSYQHLQSEKVFLEPLIWRSIKSNRKLQYYNRISFDVVVEENHTFFSDPERLEIIVHNIIRNAITFSDPQKSKPFVTIKATAAEDGAVIEVIDNGIGIGKSHLEPIFNMFYRATDRSQGAGLGLYVVKEAVERLKGSIHAESEIGFGSMFRVIIPNDQKGRLVAKKLRLQEGKLS